MRFCNPHLWQGASSNRNKSIFCCDAATANLTKTDLFGETGLFEQTQLLVDFSFRIGRLQLVAGRQHGQATNHTVHIKAIGRTCSGFDARFG